jgi:hypothetical protein
VHSEGSGHRFIDRRTQEDTFVREALCVFEQIGAIRKSPLPTVERLRRVEPRLIVVRASLADRKRVQAIGTRGLQQLDHRKYLRPSWNFRSGVQKRTAQIP